jgi:hypothetical protein
MTTKRKRTATAPTYTTTRIMAINSAPIKTKRPAALKNARIRYKTECTGFREDTTITPAAMVTKANA